MKIRLFKKRCLICWKGFKVPMLPDSTYGEYLFVDYKTYDFKAFNWWEYEKIHSTIKTVISNNPKLEIENDNTKGNTAVKLAGVLAKGNYQPIFGRIKCPRCSCKIQSFTHASDSFEEIEDLNFDHLKDMDGNKQIEYLQSKI